MTDDDIKTFTEPYAKGKHMSWPEDAIAIARATETFLLNAPPGPGDGPVMRTATEQCLTVGHNWHSTGQCLTCRAWKIQKREVPNANPSS